jgi:hypothetical protein
MLKLKSENDIKILKGNLTARKSNFMIERKGQKVYIVNKLKRAAVYYNSKADTKDYFQDYEKLSLLRKVHNEIQGFIVANDFHVEKIPENYPSMNMDRKRFAELPDNTKIVSFDMLHAYWLSAYKLGYISKRMYNKYAGNEDYKLARNIALSTLTSRHDRDIYLEGKHFHNVICDNTLESIVYKNIRCYTYNVIGELHELIGEGSLGYRVDGVYSINDAAIHDFVDSYFKGLNLPYEIEYYRKINDKQVRSEVDGREKQF